MPNTYFEFKQFRIEQDRCAMKVTTDACVFGAWLVDRLRPDSSEPNRILDIGSGTGLLSLMIAQSIPNAYIHSIEIDAAAAEQGMENVRRSPWSDRIQIEQIDILNFDEWIQFDRIVSNPPFYEQELTGPDRRKNQAHHDESLPFTKLIGRLQQHLKDDGRFFLLLPAKNMDQRLEMMNSAGLFLYQLVAFHHSSAHPTNRYFLEGGKSPLTPCRSDTIHLQEHSGGYTERIRKLLKDYYLSF